MPFIGQQFQITPVTYGSQNLACQSLDPTTVDRWYDSGVNPNGIVLGTMIYTDSQGFNLDIDAFDRIVKTSLGTAITIKSNGEVVDMLTCTVTPTTYNIDISEEYSTGPEACNGNLSITLYSSIDYSSLQPGDILYTDDQLTQAFTTPSGQDGFFLLGSTGNYIQISGDPVAGEIMDIQPCAGGPATVYSVFLQKAKFGTGDTNYCNNSSIVDLYYVSELSINSVAELAQYNYYPFLDPNSANSYANDLNNNQTPSLVGIAPMGLYGDDDGEYYVWDKNQMQWSSLVQCTVAPAMEVYAISLAYSSEYEDPNAAEFCTSTKEETTYYYKWLEGTNLSLMEIAQNNIPIYETESTAMNQVAAGMVSTNLFDDLNEQDGYYVWVNDNQGVNPQWYGFDGSGSLTQGQNIEAGGDCSIFSRPAMYGTEVITNNDPFVAGVFYSFWSCVPIINGTSIVWPMYVVDGAHFVGGQNHISDFVDMINSLNLPTFKNPDGECVEYAHTIVAEDLAEATSMLELIAGYDASWIQQKPAEYIGIFSNNTVILRSDCNACNYLTPPSAVYGFPVIEGSTPTEFGPNFDTETNYQLDNVAKPLLRINPKLTTNVKIVANQYDEIFMESISATKELSAVEYKKQALNRSGSYAYDLAKFFNDRKTPADMIFATKRESSDYSVLDSYQYQVEETYQYGTTLNYSKLHDAKFRMFAPIWADLNMPKKFVIYKVNNPVDRTDLTNSAADNFTRIQTILANAEIVNVFDLSRSSALGTYIRNHVQDQSFPKTPLTFSFEKGEASSYNGIDLTKGGFTKKAEHLYKDVVEQDKPLIDFNDFITDGFKRNNMAVANILNLEFLFDDPNATDYSVNRYFGLYVDDIDSGYGNVASSNHGKIKFSTLESYVDPAVKKSAIPSNKMMTTMPVLGYVSAANKYFKITNNKFYDEARSVLQVSDVADVIPSLVGIKKSGRTINLKKYDAQGFDYVKFNVVDTPIVNDNIAIVGTKEEAFRVTFVKHVPNVQVTMEDSHNHAIVFSTGNNVQEAFDNFETAFAAPLLTFSNHFDLTREANSIVLTEKKAGLGNLKVVVNTANGNIIRVDHIYTNVNLFENTYFAADSGELPKGTFSGNKFSSDGTPKDIAIALVAAINAAGRFTALNVGNTVYVKNKVAGYRLMQHVLLVSRTNNSLFVEPENADIQNDLGLSDTVLLAWDAYYMSGGNSAEKAVLVNKETVSKISVGERIPTRYNGKYNLVRDIVEHVDDLSSGFYKIILSDKNLMPDGETQVYWENGLRIGLFSAYDIYDMNFDFYDTSNSDLKELKYETVENMNYVPYVSVINAATDPSTLTATDVYSLPAGSSNGQYAFTDDGFVYVWDGAAWTQTLAASDIFNEDFNLTPIEYFANLLPLLKGEDTTNQPVEKIYSEYDRLKENYTTGFATKSRVTPNINKWVLNDVMTVRDQPYYLNANEAFGKTNFAPDLTSTERDRNLYSHEWFYMDRIPAYFRYNMVNDSFSYINFIQDFELTKDLFKSVDYNYFDKFMVSDGLEIKSDSSNVNNKNENDFDIDTFIKTTKNKKYSLVEGGNDLSFANTIFKGIKVLFKSRKEFTKTIASEFNKNTEFNGYKFSTLVRVNTSASENSISYEVIQNKKFEFVVFYITLNISDFWAHGTLNRKLMYELDHRIVYNTVSYEYEFSNVALSGALKLNTVDFTGNGPYIVPGVTHNSGTNPLFNDQISVGNSNVYGRILIEVDNGVTYAASVLSVNSQSELTILEIPYDITNPTNILQPQLLTNAQQLNATYVYEGGGSNAHNIILKQLSAAVVANVLNLNDDSVTYTTVNEDGTESLNRFVINFEAGKEIIKKAHLIAVEDIKKPESYKLFKGTIGYEIREGNTYYPFLVRHSGNYTVDLKPVVTFTDVYTHFKVNRDHSTLNPNEKEFEEMLYKHSLSSLVEINIARAYYNKYNRTGVAFNIGFIKDGGTHDSNWGMIKNHFFHKVNEVKPAAVTKLSATSDSLPLYPLIAEIAIDKKDMNVFKSSWDGSYYTRSEAGGVSTLVPGTFDTVEERSYLGSTAMTLADGYELMEFTSTKVVREEDLEKVLKNDTNTTDIVYFEDSERLIADFYISDVTYKKLRDSGVLNTIVKFVRPENSIGDKTSLVDDTESYVTKNLLEIFTLDLVELYVREHKEGDSQFFSSASADELDANGFDIERGFTYKLHNQTPLNFRLIYNKRLGYSYDIRPLVKIKS